MVSEEKRSESPASDDYDRSKKWTTVIEAESKSSEEILQAGEDASKKEAGKLKETVIEVAQEADPGECDGSSDGSNGEEGKVMRKGGFNDYFVSLTLFLLCVTEDFHER